MSHHRRPHQKRAVSDSIAGFELFDRGQFISACGTGKTLSCLWIKEDLDAQRTLVLVPSLALISQCAAEWRNHNSADQQYVSLCVCSDSTVGQVEDEVDFTSDDLKREGLAVTSDPRRIADFLKQETRQVIFSTYQSSHLIETAQTDEFTPSFDLAIADEAHRCAGNPNSQFAIILDERRIHAKKRLFATATPRIYKLKKGQESAAIEFVDMSSEVQFGPRFHTLTFGEAIRQGILSDYQVVIMMIDESDVQSGLTKADAMLQASQVGLLKAIQEFGLRKVISFHSYVKSAEEFAKTFPQVAAAMPSNNQQIDLSADFVSGKMTTQVRKQKLKVFGSIEKGQCHTISNARCLSEGVDTPDLDGLAFIDPRSSETDIIQALGRVIRKHEGKTHGTIVLPVFVSKDDDVGKVIKRSNFQPIWDVLSALRAHDVDFESALNERRQEEGGGASGNGDPFAKIKIVGTERVVELSRAIRPMIIHELTDGWEARFGAAKAYFEKYGHCNAHIKATWPENDPNGFNLGKWINHQRTALKQGKLSNERKEKLESISVIWNSLDGQWEKGFACVKAYFEKYGHCNVPTRSTWPENDPNGFNLGTWTTSQRTAFKQGKLPNERIEKMKTIGMVWNLLDEQWEKGLACAKAYFEKYGHCNAHIKATWPENDPSGFNFGAWISRQRKAFKQEKLPNERIESLESLGMEWNLLDEQWEKGLACAKAYFEKYEHCNVPARDTWPENDPNGFNLGKWLNHQRTAFKQEKLPNERRESLESLGMEWNLLDEQWEKGFACAKAYFEKYGHCNVPARDTWPENDPNGFNFGKWLSHQRTAFKQGKLSNERIESLEFLGMEWNLLDEQWEKGFACVKAYFEKYGRCNVPAITTWPENDPSGFNLGTWISRQRKAFKQGRLSNERIEKLMSVDMIWNAKQESTPAIQMNGESEEFVFNDDSCDMAL